MPRDNERVVNTQEQSRTVNPGDIIDPESGVGNNVQATPVSADQQPDVDIPDTEKEIPQRIEGDDASGIERKIPNM